MADIEKAFLERDFLQDEFLTSTTTTNRAFQFNVAVNADRSIANQFAGVINNYASRAFQFEQFVADQEKSLAFQFNQEVTTARSIALQGEQLVDAARAIAAQFEAFVDNVENSIGLQFDQITEGTTRNIAAQFEQLVNAARSRALQFEAIIEDKTQSVAHQFKLGNFLHAICENGGFLEGDFLSQEFLARCINVGVPIQFEAIVAGIEKSVASQFEVGVTATKSPAVQHEVIVNAARSLAVEFKQFVNASRSLAMQLEQVVETDRSLAAQFEVVVADVERSLATQFELLIIQAVALQFNVNLYNSDRLRVLCEFASRGVDPASNWTATNTAAGDYNVNNINTDIIEQVWRTQTGTTNATIVCDAGTPRFVDTLAILNHNLTASATVIFEGADDPSFSPVGVSLSLATLGDTNLYWISPTLPTQSFRYWRLVITDLTNSDNYLKIGIVLFGSAIIFNEECFSNPIKKRDVNFVDGFQTEAFTSIQNDRGLRREIGLDFENLNSNGGNYDNLLNLFRTYRTTPKCLWIPDPRYPSRYAIYGKLTEIPQETHQDMGEDADYVSFSVEIDEAK